jgi:hypothetical protein
LVVDWQKFLKPVELGVWDIVTWTKTIYTKSDRLFCNLLTAIIYILKNKIIIFIPWYQHILCFNVKISNILDNNKKNNWSWIF